MNYIKKFLAITLIFVMQFQSVHASVAIGGGWSLNLTRVENSTNIFTAFKNGFQSTVAISPSSAQVAKSLLRGGLVGLALSAVTQALLDGIDYVMDSAKQELRYKPIDKYTGGTSYNSNYCTNSNFSDCPTSTPYLYSSGTLSGVYFTTLDGACERFKSDMGYGPHSWYCLADYKERNLILYRKSDNLKDREFGWIKPNGGYSSSYDKSIPLTTLATQIINLAEQGNPDAKAYITSVVQDMLEHDEEYRKSLEAQLDAKLKEAQSIGSNNGNNNNGGNSNSGNNSATKPVPSTSGNSTTANPTPPNNDDEEDANQKIDNLLRKTNQVKKAPENAKTTNNNIYERIGGGGFEQVMKDFNSLGLKNIRTVRSQPNDTVTIGQLRNNQWVTARSYSEDGRPTLEIAKRNIKIRY